MSLSIKNEFENTQRFIKSNINLLEKYKCFISQFEENENKIIDSLEDFKNKYEKYIDIERFSIPIIGVIDSGKSSFLNFLLGINCLEMNSDITTKCVVIIRHKKDLEENERYIYPVIIKERIKDYYIFEKDESKKSEDLNKMISERNELIKNSEDIPNVEDFFLIIEAKIPLFMKENENLGDYFEFLDIPGLDEDKKNSNSFKHSHYFNEIIMPKIAGVSLFSIFIFDAGRYMGEKCPEIYKEYIDKYFPKNFDNSFFILNKIDKLDNEEEGKKKFIDNMLVDKLKIDKNNPNIHIQFLSCLKLTSESKKYEDFFHYLEYLLINSKDKNQTNFLVYLRAKMKEEFKLDLKTLIKEEPATKELEEINNKLQKLEQSRRRSYFQTFLKPKDYYKYSVAFNEINLKNSTKLYNLKIEKYKDLFNAFNKSFNNSFSIFIKIQSDESLKDKIKQMGSFIDKMANSTKEEQKKTQEYIESLYNGLVENSKLTIDQFQNLRPIVEKLYHLSKNITAFKTLMDDFNLIEFYIQKDKKLRIPFLGGYSAGKSSILNCIIGKEILPVGNEVTTRNGIVIRNNDENKYILSETKFIPKGEYYCFEEGKVLYNCDESNYKDIYDFLDNKNKDQKIIKKEDMFYLLSVPIMLFKKLNFEKDILNKIELIDYPGINVGENRIEMEVFNPLMTLSDSFIFVNNCDLINNQGIIITIKKIVCAIEQRQMYQNYNSFLFVINKIDESNNNNIDLENVKRKIKHILFEENKSLVDIFKIKEKQDISISLFSCLFFKNYLVFYEKIKDFENYIKSIIEEIKIEKEEEEENYDLIDEIKNNINYVLELYYKKKIRIN